jgi:hypothetical protein
VTLAQHLAAGYQWQTHHKGADPAPVTRKEIPAAELEAEIVRLAVTGGIRTIVKRDHISRVHVDYMRRVLELKVKDDP